MHRDGFSRLAANYLLCGLVLAAVTATHDSVRGAKLHNPTVPVLRQKPAVFICSDTHKTSLLLGFALASSKGKEATVNSSSSDELSHDSSSGATTQTTTSGF